MKQRGEENQITRKDFVFSIGGSALLVAAGGGIDTLLERIIGKGPIVESPKKEETKNK